MGQFEAIKEHLIALRDISDALNARSGKIAHEIVTDGSVYYGANPTRATPTSRSSSRARSRSCGAGPATTASATRSTTSPPAHALRHDTLDEDKDGWPEGLGNVERAGMGEEKLDNTVYYVRGLYDLADMAAAKRDRATERWARGLADRVRARFDATWWDEPSGQYADSLENPSNARIQQKHWIGQTPMEAELTVDGAAVPAWRRSSTARPRSPSARTPATAASRPYNRGLFHTGCGGGPTGAGEQSIFSLNTAIQAVGLGNYGRDASRYTGANSAPMFEPDEMPGALPEILPSPGFDATAQRPQHRPLLDLPRDVRAGLGPLRHRLAGGAPAARRAPVAGHRRARGRAAAAAGSEPRGGPLDPARRGCGGRARRAVRPALRDDRRTDDLRLRDLRGRRDAAAAARRPSR